mgnify:CR=1 FL=1|jgi:hypothetical protein
MWRSEERCPYAHLCFFKYCFVASHVTTNNPPGLHSEVLVAGRLCSSVFQGRRLPELDCFLAAHYLHLGYYIILHTCMVGKVFAQQAHRK